MTKALKTIEVNPYFLGVNQKKSSTPRGAALGADGGIRTHVALLPN